MALQQAAIAGATASSYTRTNVQTTDAGSYSVAISNSAGSTISDDATLTVNNRADPLDREQPNCPRGRNRNGHRRGFRY